MSYSTHRIDNLQRQLDEANELLDHYRAVGLRYRIIDWDKTRYKWFGRWFIMIGRKL